MIGKKGKTAIITNILGQMRLMVGLSQGQYICDVYQPQQSQWIRYDYSTLLK